MALAWNAGEPRWDLLAQTIPEPVLNGWMEWFAMNPVMPAQRDQFQANLASGIMASNGLEMSPQDLMRVRMLKAWTPLDEDEGA